MSVYFLDEYKKIKDYSYLEYCKYLQDKHGACEYDYMRPTFTTIAKAKRTKEGLYIHHLKEDKTCMLSKPLVAKNYPHEWQQKHNLIPCTLLEHLLLHIMIAKESWDKGFETKSVSENVIGKTLDKLNHEYSDRLIMYCINEEIKRWEEWEIDEIGLDKNSLDKLNKFRYIKKLRDTNGEGYVDFVDANIRVSSNVEIVQSLGNHLFEKTNGEWKICIDLVGIGGVTLILKSLHEYVFWDENEKKPQWKINCMEKMRKDIELWGHKHAIEPLVDMFIKSCIFHPHFDGYALYENGNDFMSNSWGFKGKQDSLGGLEQCLRDDITERNGYKIKELTDKEKSKYISKGILYTKKSIKEDVFKSVEFIRGIVTQGKYEHHKYLQKLKRGDFVELITEDGKIKKGVYLHPLLRRRQEHVRIAHNPQHIWTSRMHYEPTLAIGFCAKNDVIVKYVGLNQIISPVTRKVLLNETPK